MGLKRILIKSLIFIKEEWKVLIPVTLSVVMSAAAVSYFTIPYQFPDLGVSGLAVLTNYAFGISPVWVIFLGNLALLIWGWRELTPRFVCFSSYYVALFSILLPVFAKFPIVLPDDRFLAAVISGVIKGISGAIVLKAGGSGGGTDIIAVAMRKRYGIEVGKFSVYVNMLILALSLGVVGLHSTIYGVVALYVFGVVVDNTTQSFDRKKQALIITSIPHELTDYIIHTFNRSATILHGEGGYTGNELTIVIALLDQRQVTMVKNYLRKNDSNAFVSISDASEVLGRGFKSWKTL